MNLWTRETTGRIVYNHFNTVKKNDPIRLLERKE